MNKALVIGVGNRFRGDDAAGLEVASSLEIKLGSLVDIAYCHGDAMDLMDIWFDRDRVFVIDAVSSGKHEVGYLHRLLAHEGEVPAVFSESSTHLLGIAQVIELARTLNKLPREVVLYGIEGRDYHLEKDISQKLRAELKEITMKIEMDIRKFTTKN